MKFEEFRIYLPKYLSSESERELFAGLKDFPENIDDRIYSTYLQNDEVLYQGDGIKDLLVFNFPKLEKKKKECIVLSNTCDIDPNNKRNFPSQIIYAPIIKLEDYIHKIIEKTSKTPIQVQEHINAIRKQKITQIFYLPPFSGRLEESIVFLDRIFNLPNGFIDREKLNERRIFNLSDYGIYLFLYKISIHFTRIQDRVERKSTRL